MPRREAESPPIAVADATPWTWVGEASAISYQIRFYALAEAFEELDQTGGDRTVGIQVVRPHYYPDVERTSTHTSTIEDAPPTLIPAGEWTMLGLGTGQSRVTFTAVLANNPAGSAFYRVLVTW